jgi:hypothetical protein
VTCSVQCVAQRKEPALRRSETRLGPLPQRIKRRWRGGGGQTHDAPVLLSTRSAPRLMEPEISAYVFSTEARDVWLENVCGV